MLRTLAASVVFLVLMAGNCFAKPVQVAVVSVGKKMVLRVVDRDGETRNFHCSYKSGFKDYKAGDLPGLEYNDTNSAVLIFVPKGGRQVTTTISIDKRVIPPKPRPEKE